MTENLQTMRAFRKAPRSLTLLEEVNYATGTSKATGDGGTFDNLFPSNHDKYGYMDYQSWRNMKELRLGLSAQPTKTLGASADYHRFGLASAHGCWYSAAGTPMLPAQKRAIDYGTDTGSEVDATATYKPSIRVAWYGGISEFYPGSFQQRVQGKASPSTWLFLQTTLTY